MKNLSGYEETIALKWPYPVRYGEETEISCDVLILGGGIAGAHAALNAARKGAAGDVAVLRRRAQFSRDR